MLHPSHNEFSGCWCVMDIIKESAEGVQTKMDFRVLDVLQVGVWTEANPLVLQKGCFPSLEVDMFIHLALKQSF